MVPELTKLVPDLTASEEIRFCTKAVKSDVESADLKKRSSQALVISQPKLLADLTGLVPIFAS